MEIARQLRLRDLSGRILIDFLEMEGRPERLMQDGLFASASLSHSAWPAGSLLVEYDSRRVNLAARLVFFEQLQILAGLYAFRGFGGGISWRIPL